MADTTPTMSTSLDHSSRKRVSQACQPCGLKKIKCDGSLPICTPCQTKSIDCSYGVSKRRARNGLPGSPRPHPALSHNSLPHPSPYSREELPRPISANNHYSLPPINRIHEHNPRRYYSTVSAEVSTRLFQTYFNCIHPLWPILYKPLYASLDYASPSDVMPPALVAAVYAIASCVDKSQLFATNTIVQRYPEPREFFDEALDLLQGSNDRQQPANILTPSITSCQVLAILLLQQHGLAEYSRAAMLCGLASAMAIELRLHRPHEGNDPIATEVRSRLWWNLFILEKMLSCEMGKPILLRSEEADCSWPSVSEADEFELMSSYTRQRSSDQVRSTSIKLRTISVLHTSIKLAFIMERISREIYGISARKAIRGSQAAGESKRMDVWIDLRDWERDIEASPLQLDLSDDLTSVPGAITNYVIMWHGTILLHRPFIARWKPDPKTPDSTINPLQICLQAANNICLILEKYFDRLPGLPCDMVFSVFTAASTLLYHSKQLEADAGIDTQRRLKLCIHWLSILGKSWKSAGARQQLLSDMFDLPRHLQDSTNGQPLQPNLQTPFGQSTQRQEFLSASPSLGSSGGPQESLEDWGFLRDFGDSTDEFYALDVELLGLLNVQQVSQNNGFV